MTVILSAYIYIQQMKTVLHVLLLIIQNDYRGSPIIGVRLQVYNKVVDTLIAL